MPAWMGRRGLWDVVFIAVIAVAGAVSGSSYVSSFMRTARPDFGQTEFSAAVMLTCGRGFAEPITSTPALDDFLMGKSDTFSCDQLTPAMTPHGVNLTQKLYRYLMTAVAWQWKWSGISWTGLSPLFGIAFALTLCAAYGLFRLAAGPIAAAIGVVPLAISAHQLAYLPQLRDYAKAPFILLLMLVLARLVMPPFTRRHALPLAIAFGAVLGIGFGFRNDLLINIPPFVFCLFLAAPGGWRDNLWLKGQCLAAAASVFLIVSWPIVTAYASGSNTGHVAVLGLTSSFDPSLGVSRPVYDLGPHYLDGYGATLINTYSRLHQGPFVPFLSPAYDAAAVGLTVDVARHFPADIVVRGLAATLQVLEFPFTVDTRSPGTPSGITSPRLRRFYEGYQQPWLHALAGWGLWLTIASVVIVGATSPRAGVALVVLLLYYGGYPAVQFSARHFFHLEVFAWWALIFVAVSVCRWLVMLAAASPASGLRLPMRNSAVTAAALAAIVLGPLTILRAYQQRHVAALVQGYRDAHRVPLTLERPTEAGGATLVTAAGLWDGRNAADPFDVRYLVAGFSAGRCGAATVPVTLKYEAKTQANDFSYPGLVEISPGAPTEWLVPAYYNGQWSHFAGFELPSGLEHCLTTISRIDDLSGIPLLLDLRLAPGWQDTSLYQRVAAWEGGVADSGARR